MDLWDYFRHKEREFDACSAYPDRPMVFQEQAGSNGTVGRIVAFLGLTEDAYMKVTERVVVPPNGQPYRESYSYALVIEEAFAYGWERDPYTHPEMPVHEHGPAPYRTRSPSEPVTLTQALEHAWDEISLRADTRPPEEEEES